jgi:hypothetical protein
MHFPASYAALQHSSRAETSCHAEEAFIAVAYNLLWPTLCGCRFILKAVLGYTLCMGTIHSGACFDTS